MATFNQTSSPSAVQLQQHSPWHSPVPYLFGGLAAMLGLIAFALLVLACSYWKLSNRGNNAEEDTDLETGNEESLKPPPQHSEDKILVIMAGEVKPTFLATPMSSSSRASSFNDGKTENCQELGKGTEIPKEGSDGQVMNDNTNVQT